MRWCSGLTEDSESGHVLFRVAVVGLIRRTRGFLRLLRGKSEFSQRLFFKISFTFLLQFVQTVVHVLKNLEGGEKRGLGDLVVSRDYLREIRSDRHRLRDLWRRLKARVDWARGRMDRIERRPGSVAKGRRLVCRK